MKRPRTIQQAPTVRAPTNVERALAPVREAVQAAQRSAERQVIAADLVVGRNAIQHALGRAAVFVAVMPAVANAGFAWGVVANNPHPDRQVLIDVVGVAQPGAAVLVM